MQKRLFLITFFAVLLPGIVCAQAVVQIKDSNYFCVATTSGIQLLVRQKDGSALGVSLATAKFTSLSRVKSLAKKMKTLKTKLKKASRSQKVALKKQIKSTQTRLAKETSIYNALISCESGKLVVSPTPTPPIPTPLPPQQPTPSPTPTQYSLPKPEPTATSGHYFTPEIQTPAPTATPTRTPMPTYTPTRTPTPVGGGGGFNSYPISSFYLFVGCDIYAQDGQFLGVFSQNQYSSDSINNSYGPYGSNYSTTSIFNKFSTYGSAYSSYSAFNELATYPPIIYCYGEGQAYLTINDFKTPRVDSNDLLYWLG